MLQRLKQLFLSEFVINYKFLQGLQANFFILYRLKMVVSVTFYYFVKKRKVINFNVFLGKLYYNSIAVT